MRLKKSSEDSMLTAALTRAHSKLRGYDPNSEEYRKVLDQIVKLHKMKETETPSPVSHDTLVLVASNLLGIVMVLKHEQARIITSKAWNMIKTPR